MCDQTTLFGRALKTLSESFSLKYKCLCEGKDLCMGLQWYAELFVNGICKLDVAIHRVGG